MDKVNVAEKLASFWDHWRPRVVAELNGQELKLVKLRGEFVWHSHEEADELFLVWRGRLRIELPDQVLHVEPGELVVVPRSVQHRTAADVETEVLVFEPVGTRNTGDVVDPRLTAPERETI